MKPYELYKSLHARGESLKTLADKTRIPAQTLSMVFNGKRGANSRKHIAPHLQPAELKILGWNASGELVRTGEKVPRETTSHR
jgi:hypothetical protein